jgi:hypothetical protein
MARKTEQEQPADRPFRLHGDLLTTTLLALLRNWNAYGYQLAQQLAEAGLPAFDSGTVYRTLRQLGVPAGVMLERPAVGARRTR